MSNPTVSDIHQWSKQSFQPHPQVYITFVIWFPRVRYLSKETRPRSPCHLPTVMWTMILFQEVNDREKTSEKHIKSSQDQSNTTKIIVRLIRKINLTESVLETLTPVATTCETETNGNRPSSFTSGCVSSQENPLVLHFSFYYMRKYNCGQSHVHWCVVVGMDVCHVVTCWMFLGVCTRRSLS